MKKVICALFGLSFSLAAHSTMLPTPVQFDAAHHQWNQNGSAIPNMPYLNHILTLGKNSIALGCENISTCNAENGDSQIISFYDNDRLMWSPAQYIENMNVIFDAGVFLDDALPSASLVPAPPVGWIFGIQSYSPPIHFMMSYFDGKQFLPAAPTPIDRFPSIFNGFPFTVYHHKLWTFIPRGEHKVYWTANTEWHEFQSVPVSPTTDLLALSKDNTSQEIYLLGLDNKIYHLLPNETWDTPISVPTYPNMLGLSDIRVMNQGKIMVVLGDFNGSHGSETHLLLTQDGGKTWRDTGPSYGDITQGFISIDTGNKLHIFWAFDSNNNSLYYFNSYETNPSWKSAGPVTGYNYKLVSSINGDQVWLYGNDMNNNFVAFYYDLKLKKYITTSLQGIADSIYALESSSDGKAFAYGEYQSQAIGLYFDGTKWTSTPLALFNNDSKNINMSYLPFLSPVQLDYVPPLIPFRQMVDPVYNNVWLFNQQ